MNLYHIEPIDRKYNSEMLQILRSSPIVTNNLTVCFDRQPDIFRLAEIKYNPHFYYGLFRLDVLKGFGMLGYHEAMINSKSETLFHLKDFYVSSEGRGRGFGFRISGKLFRETYDNSSAGYAVLMSGNREPHRYIGHRNNAFPYMPYSRHINQLDARNIILALPVRVSKKYSIRHALESDIPSIVTLLNNEHKLRLFGNIYQETSFESYLSKCPGLKIEDYYLAFNRTGNLSGVCAAWDCTSFKQTRVIKYGRSFFPARLAYGTMRFLLGLPSLPEPGEPFKDFYITDYAVNGRDPAIMNALLRFVYNEYRNKGYQNMIWGSSVDDPLLKATKGLFFQSVISDIVLISTNSVRIEPGAIRNYLPYIDLPCL
jgi:hypothetical protein